MERVKRKVAGRQEAEAVVELVNLPHPDCIDAFLAELRRRLVPEQVAVEESAREQTIRELSGHMLQFGAHTGKRLDEIDRDYLYWLLESAEQTVATVGEYLRVTEERGQESYDPSWDDPRLETVQE